MAWLHAAPKSHEKDQNPRSRLSKLPDDHHAKKLPEADELLTLCFRLLGFCLSNGMGATPITWAELDAFLSRSGYSLTGWDCEQLIMMSRTYCSFLHEAKELNCPAPYQELEDDEDYIQKMRDRVARQWGGFAGGFKNKKQGAL